MCRFQTGSEKESRNGVGNGNNVHAINVMNDLNIKVDKYTQAKTRTHTDTHAKLNGRQRNGNLCSLNKPTNTVFVTHCRNSLSLHSLLCRFHKIEIKQPLWLAHVNFFLLQLVCFSVALCRWFFNQRLNGNIFRSPTKLKLTRKNRRERARKRA